MSRNVEALLTEKNMYRGHTSPPVLSQMGTVVSATLVLDSAVISIDSAGT